MIDSPSVSNVYWTRRRFLKTASSAGALLAAPMGGGISRAAAEQPKLPCFLHSKVSYAPSIANFAPMIQPGADAFVTEKYAAEIEGMLDNWQDTLRSSARDLGAVHTALAPKFSGANFGKGAVTALRAEPPLETDSVVFSAEPVGSNQFVDGLREYFAAFEKIEVADLSLHGIEVTGSEPLGVTGHIHYNVYGLLGAGKREQRTGEWELGLEKDPSEGWKVLSWQALNEVRSRLTGPGFVEMSAQAFAGCDSYRDQLLHGVDHWRTILDSTCGIDIYGNCGVAIGDMNGDGFDDIYVCQPAGLPNRLYRNRGDGTFEDVTEAAGVGVLDGTASAMFADLNNNGHQDLIVLRINGPLLFINRGDGTFELKPDAFDFARPPQGSFTGVSVGDYNRDGLLDVYLCTYSFYEGLSDYIYPKPFYDARNGPPNFLFRNRGDHSFEDVTVPSGLDVSNNRFSFVALWNDYNRDGWLDLYVVNDFGRKILYRNNGNGTFTDVSVAANVENPGEGMSATFLDYDNDGLEDIYAVNMWEPTGLRVITQPEFLPGAPDEVRAVYAGVGMGNVLLHNNGAAGNFEDVTEGSRTRVGGWNWCSDSWDLDHDGYSELYIVNGFLSGEKPDDLSGFYWRQVAGRSLDSGGQSQLYADAWSAVNEFARLDYSWSGHQRNNFYLNNRNSSFAEAGGVLGLDCIQDGRTFVLSDLDGDGRLEVVVKNRNAPQLRLFHNQLKNLGDSIAFALKGTKCNRDAIGAEVEIRGAFGIQRKAVWSGTGFLAQNTRTLFFGLGEKADKVNALVTWPGGEKQTFNNLPAGHRIEIVQGSAEFKAVPFREFREREPVAAIQVTGDLPATQQTWLIEPIAPPKLALKAQDGTTHSLDNAKGRKQLLVFWTESCDESKSYLQSLYAAKSALGIELFPVLVADEGAAPETSAAQSQVGFPVLLADRETAGAYSIFYRYLFDRRREMDFPLSFLLDDNGEVVKIYTGTVRAEQIAADARNMPAGARERMARALPFAGRYYLGELHHNYFADGLAYLQYEYTDQALLAFERAVDRNPKYSMAYFNIGLIYLNRGALDDARTNLQKAVALDERNADAWNNLGVVEAQSSNLSEARRDFERALTLHPSLPIAVQNMVKLYRFQGRDDDAADVLKRAIAADATQAEFHQELAMLYVDQKNLDEAKVEFEEAVRLEPGDATLMNGLGAVLLQMGDADKALDIFRQCQRLAPEFDRPYLNMAGVYMMQGKMRQAHDVLTGFLARQPDNADVKKALEQVDGNQ